MNTNIDVSTFHPIRLHSATGLRVDVRLHGRHIRMWNTCFACLELNGTTCVYVCWLRTIGSNGGPFATGLCSSSAWAYVNNADVSIWMGGARQDLWLGIFYRCLPFNSEQRLQGFNCLRMRWCWLFVRAPSTFFCVCSYNNKKWLNVWFRLCVFVVSVNTFAWTWGNQHNVHLKAE